MATAASNKKTYIPLAQNILAILSDEATALLVYCHLLDAVTKEIISPEHGRFGMVLNGDAVRYADLAVKTGLCERTLRSGMPVLVKRQLAKTRRGSYGLQIFLLGTNKWIAKDSPRVRPMSPLYKWADEVMSQNDDKRQSQNDDKRHEKDDDRQSRDDKRQSGDENRQSQPFPAQQIQQDTPSSYRFKHTERTNTEHKSVRSQVSKPDGQGKNLIDALALLGNDQLATFDKGQTREVVALLTEHTAEEIKAAFREMWDGATDDFARKHFARTFAAKAPQVIAIHRGRVEQARKTQELIARTTAQERARAESELAAVIARDAAEAELIEEFLPNG